MRPLSKHSRIIITVAIIAIGVAFLYYVPITRPLFNLRFISTPTATPDYSSWRSYTNQKYGISLKYPSIYQLVPGKSGLLAEWELYGLTNGVEIVSIDIPGSTQIRTNFGDATLRIGISNESTAIKQCLNPPDYSNTYQERIIGGLAFRKFIRSGVGAGNYYDFVSYRAIQNGGCEVFEHVIHYSNIQNYPPEANRKEFDKNIVINSLESILDTVQFIK